MARRPKVQPEVQPEVQEEVALGTSPEVSEKKILGHISGVIVLKKEDYLNPVTKKMYQRFHLADGTTQVLSDEEVSVLYKEAK